MKREKKLPFDPKAFLSKVNGGRAISDYRKDQNVYTQGEPADSVFYIQSGKVKKTVVSEQGKEAVVALLDAGNFFGEGCLAGEKQRTPKDCPFDRRSEQKRTSRRRRQNPSAMSSKARVCWQAAPVKILLGFVHPRPPRV